MLSQIQVEAATERLTLRRLLVLVGPKGHGVIMLFLVLPFLQPIPLPGVSTPFGLAIGTIGLLMAAGRPPWLPEKLAALRIESATIIKICTTLEGFMRRIERIIKPRGTWIFAGRGVQVLTGVVIAGLAFFLSLPLPIPFSNSMPALALFLLSLSILEEDAVLYSLGIFMSLLNVGFFASLVLLPLMGIKALQLQ